MRTLWTTLLACVALSVAACDSVSQAVTQVAGPHRCNVCNGTGSITQSVNTQLPGSVAQCQLEATGFLGLGSDRIATIGIQNNGDEGGMFTFKAQGNYPGGGTIDEGEATAYIAAHSVVTQQIRFTPEDGILNVQCQGTAPVVVQQHQVICPTCGGRGMVQ